MIWAAAGVGVVGAVGAGPAGSPPRPASSRDAGTRGWKRETRGLSASAPPMYRKPEVSAHSAGRGIPVKVEVFQSCVDHSRKSARKSRWGGVELPIPSRPDGAGLRRYAALLIINSFSTADAAAPGFKTTCWPPRIFEDIRGWGAVRAKQNAGRSEQFGSDSRSRGSEPSGPRGAPRATGSEQLVG